MCTHECEFVGTRSLGCIIIIIIIIINGWKIEWLSICGALLTPDERLQFLSFYSTFKIVAESFGYNYVSVWMGIRTILGLASFLYLFTRKKEENNRH